MELQRLIGGHPHTCGPDLTVEEAARSMHAAGVGSVGVVEADQLVGILTERDVLRVVAAQADPSTETVRNWMSSPVSTFDPETSVDRAAMYVLRRGHRHLPITDGEKLVGILSMRDLMGALVDPDRA